MMRTVLILAAAVSVAFVLTGEASAQAGLANPASVNCGKQGGTLRLERRADGGTYGVCAFGDGRECEEWALLRGRCAAGGLKVTGYVTLAARYCAITGGRYTVTANGNGPDEQGSCALPEGKTCDAVAYYGGRCGD